MPNIFPKAKLNCSIDQFSASFSIFYLHSNFSLKFLKIFFSAVTCDDLEKRFPSHTAQDLRCQDNSKKKKKNPVNKRKNPVEYKFPKKI